MGPCPPLAEQLGFGFVIRDSNGELVVARNGLLLGPHDAPLVWEALSCREALIWIRSNGMENVEVELDSLLLVNAINSHLEDKSSLGLIIKDCKYLLRA